MSLWDYKDEKEFREKCGYEIDGAWYPRVTKILEIKSKPALYRYYGEAASYAAAQESTKKSAEEGTMVHEAAEKILLGESPDIPEQIKPAISAFTDFLERNNIQTSPELVERRICSKDHRYAGTIDAMALMDGKFGVLDIKTSQGIYRDYNLQTSAYMDALTPEFKNLQTRWILRIDQVHTCLKCAATMRPKGNRNKIRRPWPRRGPVCVDDAHEWGELKGFVEVQEFPHWKDDFLAFLGAKTLWQWENEIWLKKIGYI
ncbi:MAG: hypothetical protein HYT12_02615 [Candidatus Liptonbacteria bacterium]|nr:hypothetical protein [Candidatus Liptonbacteria bacterium]